MLLKRWMSETCVVLLVVICCHSVLNASTMCVKVKDYADLALHDARATVVNLGTNTVSVGLTGRDGRACIAGIPEGLYSVEVGLTGFLNVRYYPVRLAYPVTPELEFRLPFGEIREGGLASDAIVSGTLRRGNVSVDGAKICLLGLNVEQPVTCGVTNDLGEYALSVPPGTYRVEVRIPGGTVHRSNIEVPAPGIYRNRITVPAPSAPQP